MRTLMLLAVAAVCGWLAGCTSLGRSTPAETALPIAYEARQAAARLPESPQKQDLASRLDLLTQVLAGSQTPATSHIAAAAQWYELFGPKSCEVTNSTRFADFDGDGTSDGLAVWVLLKDQFGDPVKALGDFRIEAFQYVPRSLDKRGAQKCNWFVSVMSGEEARKYYDAFDRSYRFPLKFAAAPGDDRLLVQATYYLPDGTGRKLFAQRLVKAGE